MTERLPDHYFDAMYAQSSDPWQLAGRWYEARKYALTMAMLPAPHYRHAFEPGCSVGVLTELLAARCDRVTCTDVAEAALAATALRLRNGGRLDAVTLCRSSLDESWPRGVDLVVMSEVAYYLSERSLRRVLDRECPRLDPGTTLVCAHWRHPVADYPLTGDAVNAIVAATPGLWEAAAYRDEDVIISVLTAGRTDSVAQSGGLPGAMRSTAGEGGCAAGR